MTFDNYPVVRELDGIYIRVERDGKWCNRCFTDLTDEEQQNFLGSLDTEGLQRMCLILAGILRKVCDQFGIAGRDSESANDE